MGVKWLVALVAIGCAVLWRVSRIAAEVPMTPLVELTGIIETKDPKAWDFTGPFGVSIGPADRVYVADDLAHQILVFERTGQWLQTFGRPGSQDGELQQPSGITQDAFGYLYVADSHNHRIQIFDQHGAFRGIFGASGSSLGSCSSPPV